MMAEMQEKYLRELRDLARNYGKPPAEEEVKVSDARSKFMMAMAEGKVTWLEVEELGAKKAVQFRTPANPGSIYTCKDFEVAWEQLEELYAQKPPAEEPQSDEVPTLTLPHEQHAEEPSEESQWNVAVRCACGEHLTICEEEGKYSGDTMSLSYKVRPHDCAAYSHAATRRVCDRLAVLLNEHFDATGD